MKKIRPKHHQVTIDLSDAAFNHLKSAAIADFRTVQNMAAAMIERLCVIDSAPPVQEQP